ncbi:MAG TPA: ABC-F family ATP-binding cassette domain-containing protein [Anaerolineales bacterium]|nr:ABC-F family ATP-binding cassette domain-containing protein [Anaerolineales bacterium]
MLTAHHIHKTYGIQPILQDISFNLNNRERVGLIGPNGCGKTTLLRILAGIEQPDSGTVASTRPNLRIGYLAQGMDLDPEQTLQSALRHAQGGALSLNPVSQADIESEIASLAFALSSNPNDPNLQAKYDATILQFSTRSVQSPISRILAHLGLADIPPETPISHLSGGQKTRLMLARVLLIEPHLLLLDEPTNHLDIEMLEWLEDWLDRFQGAALIVSHDRAFLDNTVTSILELDPSTHSITSYAGNYGDYLEQKLTEREKQSQAYQDQQGEIAQLRSAAAHIRGLTKMRKGGKADPANTDGFSVGHFGNRATKRTAGRAKHIEARIEKLLAEDRIEKPKQNWQIKLEFGAPVHQSKDVLITDNLSIGYTLNNPLLEKLNLHIRAGQRIGLTGANGTGKTTLIRTISGKLPPLAGSVRLGANVKPGYMSQEQEFLDPERSALQTIQSVAAFNETEARNFLHYFLFEDDDPLRPTRELSFGERARLQLGLLVAQGCTFLLLDEPINHLDIPSRARFEEALANFKGTILAVVHDRYFLERFASDVWNVKDGKITSR